MARSKTPKTPRTVRLVRAPAADGVGVFYFEERGQTTWYVLHEIPCEIGGRGFEVHRLGLGELYHVRVDAKLGNCSCECLGFLRHGRCKHLLGLRALVREGKL